MTTKWKPTRVWSPGDDWWMHPTAPEYPLILADGRWNVAGPEAWITEGTTQPGPASGRGPLRFADATGPDHQMLLQVLQREAELAKLGLLALHLELLDHLVVEDDEGEEP